MNINCQPNESRQNHLKAGNSCHCNIKVLFKSCCPSESRGKFHCVCFRRGFW